MGEWLFCVTISSVEQDS